MSNSQLVEVEVKFWTADFDLVREALSTAGATLIYPRYYEQNIVYDSPQETLRNRQQIIRLRQDQKMKLTFKGPVSAELEAQSEAKIREEIELEVSDFDKMALILHRLGLTEEKAYEKYREVWQHDGVEIVLDEMPFGNFIELEGTESAIKSFAAELGFSWDKRMAVSYWRLMQQLKEIYNLKFDDITFANFADKEINSSALWG